MLHDTEPSSFPVVIPDLFDQPVRPGGKVTFSDGKRVAMSAIWINVEGCVFAMILESTVIGQAVFHRYAPVIPRR